MYPFRLLATEEYLMILVAIAPVLPNTETTIFPKTKSLNTHMASEDSTAMPRVLKDILNLRKGKMITTAAEI